MPFRGRPNASYLIPHTARFMAETAGVDLAVLCQALNDNADAAFGGALVADGAAPRCCAAAGWCGRTTRTGRCPPELLDAVCAAALRAPSAGFTQGVSLLVLDRAPSSARPTGGRPPSRESRWLRRACARAPVLILVWTSRQAYLDRYAEPDKGWTDRDPERWSAPYWYVDGGMAALAMLLTAVDEGLGACFFGIPPRADRRVRAAFGVPADQLSVGVISLGYPRPAPAAGSPTRRPRTADRGVDPSGVAGDGAESPRSPGFGRVSRHRYAFVTDCRPIPSGVLCARSSPLSSPEPRPSPWPAGPLGYAHPGQGRHPVARRPGQEVSTMAGTVGDLLDREGIEVGAHDVVAPGPDTKLDRRHRRSPSGSAAR